jgi:LmbE family N-acetylglucosaminyl deacetylase
MNILAIGAHPDDIELLCAGTLALYKEEGHKVYMAVATDGSVGSPTKSKSEIAAIRKREQEASCAILGAEMIWMGFEDEWLFDDRPTRVRFLDAIREADPDVMFVHSPNDYLSDHRNAGQIAVDCRIPASIRLVETSLPQIKRVPHVFFMDNISGLGFDPEHYVDISSVVEIKQAMLEAHASQNAWIQDLYGEDISAIMKRVTGFRGLPLGVPHAEAFRSLRTYPLTDPTEFLPRSAR